MKRANTLSFKVNGEGRSVKTFITSMFSDNFTLLCESEIDAYKAAFAYRTSAKNTEISQDAEGNWNLTVYK
jgi:hypothetical protein